jgi:hypothetical protein
LDVVHVDTPIGFLNGLISNATHDLGIHDFYRYGLWGDCDGYNNTVTTCTSPYPGQNSNPIAAINAEIKSNSIIPLPNIVTSAVHDLTSVSLFIFSCWLIGTILGFFLLLGGVICGCRSRLGVWLVGFLASVLSPDFCELTLVFVYFYLAWVDFISGSL